MVNDKNHTVFRGKHGKYEKLATHTLLARAMFLHDCYVVSTLSILGDENSTGAKRLLGDYKKGTSIARRVLPSIDEPLARCICN